MKGKLNIKTIIVLIIIVLAIVLSVLLVRTVSTYMTGASGGVEPKQVVAVSDEEGKSATVSWITDKEAMGVVEYGNNPATLLLRVAETEQSTDHKVTMESLKPNVTYYYRIRIGDNVFDNNGIPYTFKSKGSTDVTANTPSVTPKVSPVVSPVASPSGIVLSPSISVQKPTPASASTSTATTTCNKTTDYNKDGVINSLDYITCTKNGGKVAVPSATPTVSTNSANTTECKGSVDFNKDGVINSLDIIKCLQSKSQ